MSHKEFIRGFFKDIFEKQGFNEEIIINAVDKEYIQRVDGKTLGFEEFVKHIKHLKEKIDFCDIEFLTLIEEGDIVFSNHIVSYTLKDGLRGKSHVIAEFRLKDGKLRYCDELTFLIEGKKENRDLGSDY